MKTQRELLGGLGNLMFLKAFIMSKVYNREIPDVYVQDYRLWADSKYHIRDYFRQGIGKTINKIALHIRRGDYLKAEDFHTNLWNTMYYQKAMKHFTDGKVLVFCMDRQNPDQDENDREWCRQNLSPLLGTYKEDWDLAPIHEDEVDDMNMMAQCRWMIGANSSFSWWAAFTGEHDKVIFPAETNWFVDGNIRCKLLPEWTQIEA